MRRKPSIPTHSPHFSQESAKMTFFRHADVCNGGAVRAAPKCRKHPVFPAWSRGRQNNFDKKILNLESPTPILTSQFPPEPPKMTFPGTATSQTAAPCARRTASMGVPCSPMACAGVNLNLQTICLMWSPPTGFPQHVLSPPFSPNPRLNLALLVANVPVASPHSPNSLSVSPGRTHRRLLHLHRLSTRALRSMWTRFGAFRLSSPVGELHVLASAGCLGYAPADYLSPHPTISTHAAVYSVHGAQFASPFVLINSCPLPLATQTSSAMGAISHCRLWQWNH